MSSILSNLFSYNKSVLSGAMDIIVIKYPDESYKSSPFKIRFGSFKIFRTKEKIVNIYVNGIKCDLTMRLSDTGEAYFQQEIKGYSSPIDIGNSAPTSPRMDSKNLINSTNIVLEQNHVINFSSNIIPYKNKTTLEDCKIPTPPDLENKTILNDLNSSIILQDNEYDLKAEKLSLDLERNISKNKIFRKLSCDLYIKEESSEIKICKESDLQYESNLPNFSNLRKMELSNCWTTISKAKEKLEEIFSENKISQEDFFKNPWKVLSSNNLAIRYGNHVYTWKVIAPIIMSNLCYGKDLPENILKDLTQEEQGYFFWKKKNQDAFKIDIKYQDINNLANSPNKSIDSQSTDKAYDLKVISNLQKKQSIQYKKTYTLTTDQIKCLNLKNGKNEISFVVSSKLQGETTLTTEIYLWNYDDKIIISDLDGTITKSDVLGQVFPMFGKDWSHKGVVKLYNNLYKNGYKILYLTARALCQSDQTKNYLNKLIQNNQKLPEGPLLMSPDGLISSFKREIIDRTPQSFKIECLTQVVNLFPPDVCPYFAGFGNKITDAISYESVGVNKNKIFIINEKGKINQFNKCYNTTYSHIDELVEEMFPDVRSNNFYQGNPSFFKPSIKDVKNIKELFK